MCNNTASESPRSSSLAADRSGRQGEPACLVSRTCSRC
jgi:hypothetical protein